MESENEVSAKGQTVHEDNARVAKDILSRTLYQLAFLRAKVIYSYVFFNTPLFSLGLNRTSSKSNLQICLQRKVLAFHTAIKHIVWETVERQVVFLSNLRKRNLRGTKRLCVPTAKKVKNNSPREAHPGLWATLPQHAVLQWPLWLGSMIQMVHDKFPAPLQFWPLEFFFLTLKGWLQSAVGDELGLCFCPYHGGH